MDSPQYDDGASPRPASLLQLLDTLEQTVEAMTAADPADLDGGAAAEASLRVHRATDRLKAQRLGWLGKVDATRAWATGPYRNATSWLSATHGIGHHEASQQVTVAGTLRDTLPTTAARARRGEVSTAQAALVARTANTERRQAALEHVVPFPVSDMRTGEELLLDHARHHSLKDFGIITRRFAHLADPEADERGFREACEREFFDLAATTGGYHLSGFLAPHNAQLVKKAMRAIIGVPAADDSRTPSQRRAGGLAALAAAVLDHGLTPEGAAANPSVRPHLIVHVSWTELRRVLGHTCAGGARDMSAELAGKAASSAASTGASAGAGRRTDGVENDGVENDGGQHSEHARDGQRADVHDVLAESTPTEPPFDLESLLLTPPAEWEDRTGPIPDPVLRRIAEDCTLARVVFGPDSQVIDVGRARRTFSGHLRRAVVARDKQCVFTGCGAPAQVSEVHHATRHWADGGFTRVPDGALLCWYHHDYVDSRKVSMTWVPGTGRFPGRWSFGAPGSYRPTGTFPDDGEHYDTT